MHGRFLLAQWLVEQAVERGIEAQPPARAVAEQGGEQGAVAGIGQARGEALGGVAQRGAAQCHFGEGLRGEGAGIGHRGERRSGRALR